MTNTDSVAVLRECPFCGNPNMATTMGVFPMNPAHTRWEVRCGNPSCFAFDPSSTSRTEAIAKWNRRHPAPAGSDAVTEEMVEAFAERFMHVRSIGMHRAWQSITEKTRADYRKAFRAGLTAALAARAEQG